eukprot:16290471-Heterocapsa_arctica.AAC.1
MASERACAAKHQGQQPSSPRGAHRPLSGTVTPSGASKTRKTTRPSAPPAFLQPGEPAHATARQATASPPRSEVEPIDLRRI